MRKRLVLKMAVMVAALGAMTLLQGCGEEEDGLVLRFAWMPIIPGVTVGTAGITVTQGGTGGDTTGAGGQVSSGAVQ